MPNATHSIAALLGTGLIALSAQAGQTTNFRLLIDDGVTFDETIYVSSISADGTTVVGAEVRASEQFTPHVGFKWIHASGTYVELTERARGIFDVSGDGSIVVGTSHALIVNPGQQDRASLWTSNGLEEIGPLQSWAYAISDDGAKAVGYAWTGPDYEASVWENGVRTAVPQTLSHRSRALGISGDGGAIFGWYVRPGEQADHGSFLHYVGGQTIALEMPVLDPRLNSVVRTRVNEANADGSVVVGTAVCKYDLMGSDGVLRPNREVSLGWIYRHGQGYELLGSFNDDNRISFERTDFESGFAISGDGNTVLGYDSESRSMIWTAVEGTRNFEDLLVDAYSIDLSGWTLSPTAMSADGSTVAGIATRESDGVRTAFIVELPAVINVCSADMNDDFAVDLGDFGAFGAAFGSAIGELNYNERADFDGDGDVDLGDFGQFGEQFGRSGTDCAG